MISKRVKEILSEFLDFPIDEIKMGSSLKNDLGLDSFSAVELIYILEVNFDMHIPKDKKNLLKMKSVKDLVNYLKPYVKNKKVA